MKLFLPRLGTIAGFCLISACSGAESTATISEDSNLTEAETPSERGFVPPTFELDIPGATNLPGLPPSPPSINDVKVKNGLDGRTPEEVVTLVKGKITNPIFPQNVRFVEETIRTTQKFFTIAVNNIFVDGSPPSRFVKGLGNVQVTLLGTMSAIHPTVLRVESPGGVLHFVMDHGAYVAFPKMQYPVIMECKIRLQPAGVMLHYPAWSAKVLAGPTGTVTEGP